MSSLRKISDPVRSAESLRASDGRAVVVMLTDSPGIPTHRTLGAALFVLASLGTELGAAPPSPQPILETNLLVFPSKAPGAGQLPSASDFRATVGKLEYEVRSVRPAAGSPDLKTIVVFDLASVSQDYRPCIIQQARAMAPALRRMGNLAVFVVSVEWTEFHKPIRYAPGEMYEYFLPEPNASAKDACASLPSSGWSDRPNPGFRNDGLEQAHAGRITCESFRGLAEALQGEHGPIRVFWIGQRFGWIHRGYAQTGEEQENVLRGASSWELSYTPNAAYWWLDAFTRSGISYLPIVWLDGVSEKAEGPKASQKYASEMAQYLGGEASVCDKDLAGCLQRLLDDSSRGWIVQITGPEVDLPVQYSAETLRIWYGPDPKVLNAKRPFARLEKPRARPTGSIGYRTTVPAVPLFDSAWLARKVGCEAGPAGGAKQYAMTAAVPDAVVRGVKTYVEVLSVSPGPPEKKLTDKQYRAAVFGEPMQLRTRSAPEVLRETGDGTAEICIDLPPTALTDGSYRIVVFNPEAGWAGVGVVPVADIIRAAGH